jgi:TP901 family phage tail tape measure protein
MALRDFLFGFKFLATDYVSPVLKSIETRIEKVNDQVKNTARWREAGTNLALVGAGFAAAGGAVALALNSTVQAAAEMQTEMTHVATAINDGAASQVHLAQAQAMSEKLAIASGLAAKQEAQAYYIARSNMLDHAQAMSAVNVATKLTIGTTASLADAQTQLEPTTRLLTTVFQNFGKAGIAADPQINRFADTMAKLQTQFAFKDIGEVNEAMSYAVPLAKSAGVAFNDMSAALAVLSASGKHGAEAGTAFAELVQKLSTAPKLHGLVARTAAGGIDLGRTLDILKQKTAGLDAIHQAMYLHDLGFTERSIVGVSLLIDKTAMYRGAVTDLSNAQGANAAAFAVRQASMEIATGRLSAAWDVFKAKIGENLLGPVTRFATMLTSVVTRLTEFATAHPAITKFLVLFAAMSAALAIVLGGAVALVGGLLAAASFIPIGGGILAAIGGIGVAVMAVGAAVATWWPQISGFFSSLWTGTHNALVGMGDAINAFIPRMLAGGANLVIALGKGIWSAITYPQHAIEAVVNKIRAYLPFSPTKEGPLRSLHRVRIVEELSRSIQPGPALSAIRRTAAAVAIAAPVMLSPMMSGPAMASASGGASGGGITIQVHQEIHIDGATAGDDQKLMATLRHHSEELAQIIDARLLHRSRREF